jgi:hypothetical protein
MCLFLDGPVVIRGVEIEMRDRLSQLNIRGDQTGPTR